MISSAIVQSAIVLMNRRMKTDRRVIRFVSVCSSVAGMHMHHLGGTNLVQARMSSVLAQYDCAAGFVECVVLWHNVGRRSQRRRSPALRK